MRLTTVLLIASILQVSASSFGQRITLFENNTPLLEVFSKIRSQSGYDFIITKSILQDAKNVNIDVEDVELGLVLKKIFSAQPLDFTIEDKSVIVTKKIVFSNQVIKTADLITVQGYVKNDNGKPLSGANIKLMNSQRGYGALHDGYYILENIPDNSSLIVSYVGYKTDTIRVRGRRQLDIIMKVQTEEIKEVAIVSTGYQTIARERVAGSFSKPDMKVFHRRAGSMDIMSRLDGLVAGLTVIGQPTSNSGIFNNVGNQRTILRGKSSINLSSDPLYVVDGVQTSNLSNINPNDVEDITVLKDAAAAAIYGAKAANGVIVVTTKRGKKNEEVKVNYISSISFQGKPKFKKNLYMNSEQYIQTAREIFNPVNNPWEYLSRNFIAPHELIMYNQYRGLISEAQANKSLDSLSHLDNRQQIKDLIYKNAFTTNHTVSAAGGSDKYSFNTSASYTIISSTVPGQINNGYRFSFNQNINPTKWFNINLSSSLNNTREKSKNPISVTDGFLPYQLFKDEQGNNIQMNYLGGLSEEIRENFQARSRLDLNYTPLDELDRAHRNIDRLSYNNTASIEIKLFKGLSFNGTYGLQKSSGNSAQYTDNSEYGMRRELLNFTKADTPQDIPVYYLPTTGGRYVEEDFLTQNWTIRNQLVYNTSLRSNKDRLNLQIGQEALEEFSKITTRRLRGYNDVLKTYALMDYLTLSKPLFGAIGSGYSTFNEEPYRTLSAKMRFASYFALFNYSINDRYMIDGSVRADKSSLFASEQSGQKKPTYSIGGKWQIAKEKFMEQVSWISDLGLRVTYGVTGNSPYIGSSSLVDVLYASTDPNFGNYLGMGDKANNKLSWESTHTINMALDFSILNSRFGGSIDIYRKNTKDLLGRIDYNPLTGTESASGNIGNIKNNGIEVSLRSENIRGNNFRWSTNLIFGYNINKLVSYSNPPQYQLTTESWLSNEYRVGYSNPTLFAYRFAGLDNMGDPQIRLADGTVTKELYVAKPEDLVHMGSTIPKFNGGFGNVLNYKGVSLIANMSYSFGAVMRKFVNTFYTGRLTGTSGSFATGNLLSEFQNRWKIAGDETFTDIPSYVSNQGDSYSRRDLNYYYYGDVNVINASFIKLRDVSFSYDFSSRLLRKLNVGHINVFVQGTNYLLWKTNRFNIDPEYQYIAKGGRSYSLGLNVTF